VPKALIVLGSYIYIFCPVRVHLPSPLLPLILPAKTKVKSNFPPVFALQGSD